VGLGLVLHDEVHVVGGNDLYIVSGPKFAVCRYYTLLQRKDGGVGSGITGLMPLYLKVVIVAEDLLV